MRKTLKRFGGLSACVVLVAALLLSLAGCATLGGQVEKLFEEDIDFLMIESWDLGEIGDRYLVTTSVDGKDFYSRRDTFYKKAEYGVENVYVRTAVYWGQTKEGDRYYEFKTQIVDYTDKNDKNDAFEYLKHEITEAEYDANFETFVGGHMKYAEAFETRFSETEKGVYTVKADQATAFYNAVHGTEKETLSDEEKAEVGQYKITLADGDAVQVTMPGSIPKKGDAAAKLYTISFSQFGKVIYPKLPDMELVGEDLDLSEYI